MSLAAAGALAAALAVTCALSVPFVGAQRIVLRVAHPDLRALDEAQWARPLWHFEVVRAICVGIGAVLSFLLPVPTIAVLVAGALAPSIFVRARASEFRWRARLATTHLLRSTEAALRSGASLPEALRRAVDATRDRSARRPFAEALRAFDLGAPLDQALQASARATDPRSRIALETLAMGIASRLSYDRAGVLVSAVADRLAFEERLDEEIHARTGGLRSQVLLLALVVPAIAAYLSFTVPSLAATLGQPIGRFVLVPAALALEVVGLIASRRAVDGARR
jgi:Flp pilus assembly protein TadB